MSSPVRPANTTAETASSANMDAYTDAIGSGEKLAFAPSSVRFNPISVKTPGKTCLTSSTNQKL